MTRVIVFGAGVSGLTAAHQLINQGMSVTLIEKDSGVGGMAKTRWERNGVPSEHSWRGWGNFYSNTFNIMKQIPYGEGTTYDNLTKEVDFFVLRNDLYAYKRNFSMRDSLVIGYDILQYLTSDDRRIEFYETKASDYYKGRVSADAYEFLLKYVQTAGYGMENKDGSVGHLLRFIVLPLVNPSKYRPCNIDGGTHCNKANDKWHLLNQPTNDGWFNPWKKHLENLGVRVMTNTELLKINTEGEKVIGVEVRTNGSEILTLKSDDYILSTNPYNTETILRNSGISDLHSTFHNLNMNTTSNQISFRIGLSKSTCYPTNYIGIVLTESPFNITFYPQNSHWDKYTEMDIPYQTLWSGTLMDSVSKGVIYQEPSVNLNIEQLKEEIKKQILVSESLQKLIYDFNGFRLEEEDIAYIEIWYEWSYDDKQKKLKQSYRKWVNNIHNERYRPHQETEYNNLFLSGAHTKTTAVIYSMEGAVESGMLAANSVLSKYNMNKTEIVNHTDPSWLQPFKMVDNVFYNIGFPNVIILIILFLLFVLYAYLRRKLI